MTNITHPATTYVHAQSSASEIGGQTILKWAALVLLTIETISVTSGILEAIMMTLRH